MSRTVRLLGVAGVLAALMWFWPQVKAQSAACGLSAAAFCETFDQGPSSVRGRGGDLNPQRWSAARLAPQDIATQPALNPVPAAPIPPCKASFNVSSVFPPDDTLICDPTATRSAQLMTPVVIHNYGMNSYMVRQPFDFAGRTGRIVFDVDAVSQNFLATFVSIDITEDPVPAPTFTEFGNFEHGPLPRNAIMIKFSENCQGGKITVGNVMTYANYVGTVLSPTFTVTPFTTPGCPRTSTGSLNHFEIQLSQSKLEVWGSDFSTDDGQTFPNFHKIYTANISLPFSRGYVHVTARNHASQKYGYGDGQVYHWDNIGFDGPVLANWRAYEVADNRTMISYPSGSSTPYMNLGYQLVDGTTGKPAGIYSGNGGGAQQVGPLQIAGVDVTGVTAARLTMSAYVNSQLHTASTSWAFRYRFNGGTWRTRNLTAGEVQALSGSDADGNLGLVIDVPVADLRAGTNTLELLPSGAPMDIPPVVANIDLVLALNGSGFPDAPTNVRVIPTP